ncbi:hypothetical protein [Pleionea sediminis]|uniref:hypothetical protein n=1 Tax=Pleionea sediminis TaxID=2569479 RepID=UPI001185A29B|nr:hypothetical protein [Pleionea sediminis]
MKNLKLLKASMLVVLGAIMSVNANSEEHVLVINGTYQIPVQAAIALEELKHEFYEKDWKAEAMRVMQNSLDDIEKGSLQIPALTNETQTNSVPELIELTELSD